MLTLAAVLVIGGAIVASAWHGPCSSGGIWEEVPTLGTGVGEATTAGNVTVCYEVINWSSPVGPVTVGGDLTATQTDPNPASVGKTVSLTYVGTDVGPLTVGPTGAEAGVVGACTANTTGACVTGTTVYVDGIAVTLGKTGVEESLHLPMLTPGTANFICVSSVCQRDATLSAGSVTAYLSSPAGTQIPVCVRLGATAPLC